MENKEQLLANFLAFKDIPFGDYKNIITTPKAMEFYAKNTPIDQLQSMFVSAGFEAPDTINKASNFLKKVYNELQYVDELSYSGEYKTGRERQELKRIMQELEGDNEEDEDSESDNYGGFFDESGIGGADMAKALEMFNQAIENGEVSDTETTFDELLGRGKSQGEGQGEGENQDKKESDQNKDNQQKGKKQQQNASLEREIELCSEEIAQLENEKELLDFLTNKTQEQELRIGEIDLNIDDLKIQISNMLGAINANLVLGNDVEFPVNRLPRYVSSKIPELANRIKDESEKRVEDPNYGFKYKIDDKKRRNALISERVKDDITYFAFEKLKRENALSELYLTNKDITRIVFEMGSDEIPKKIVLESTIEGDTVVIDEAINIDTFIYQMNNLEKDLELVNKENNIKLIFDTIKNELFNKFII